MQQTTVYKLTPVQSEVESTHVARVVIIASKTQVDRWSLVSSPFFRKNGNRRKLRKKQLDCKTLWQQAVRATFHGKSKG